MALSVSPCGNRKTWDARVRVTGGHPELLWGIGDAEALTREGVGVERVAVDRGEQTVGYGQLLVLAEDRHTVVDAKSMHVKNPRDLLDVLAALQDHARTAHGAAVLRVSPDTPATTDLAASLTEAGYRRRDRIRRGEAGPRHLVVRLGETEGELSRRLSSETLQRCRAGLRDSGVRVRRVEAADRDLSHVGLRTQHIRELLRAVGQNSVFLVATERDEAGAEAALGYLWFVHTGEAAIVYRLGFTDRARDLGVDDALLLTGLVQLQQRQVHRVLAGDPDQPGHPMVLRELATEEHEVLGTWEYPLVGEFQVAGRAEKARRRLFGRRAKRPASQQDLLPEDAVSDGPSPATTGSTPDAPAPGARSVATSPDSGESAESRAVGGTASPEPAADATERKHTRPTTPPRRHRGDRTTPGGRRRARVRGAGTAPEETGSTKTGSLETGSVDAGSGRSGLPESAAGAGTRQDATLEQEAPEQSTPQAAARPTGDEQVRGSLFGRVLAESRAAVRDAARW
ncbi:hypothetical protein [Kocuria sp.]|uniref:hypothetical protein n=1 Tax=Kocuria sp. TaxID=1871328 RepID=UPI0026DCA75A|nr:hypothetical protein [Kocuria sp.]MDO4919379.1 hypothetical protein [Kocuria sp.]